MYEMIETVYEPLATYFFRYTDAGVSVGGLLALR
jgi:hypothetical protein